MAENKEKWITANGSHIKVEEGKEEEAFEKKQVKSKEQKVKCDELRNAVEEVAKGNKASVVVPNVRDDLEQYGGSNNITIERGKSGKNGTGLLHLLENGRVTSIEDIYDNIVLGKVDQEYIKKQNGTGNTIKLVNNSIETILAYEKDKKTWVVTGWDKKLHKKKTTTDVKGKVGARHLPTHILPITSRQYVGAVSGFTNRIHELIKMSSKAKDMNIALDKNTKRHIDANGFMHVAVSNISKEIVNPYYGYEIPNYAELGLDPDKVYNVYRTGKALEEGAKSFNNLPLMRDHYIDSAESPQREHRVGSVGSDCVFVKPYLQTSLCVTDGEAIRKIESGERVELSCAYSYTPIVESGVFDGQEYDIIMSNIRGNHVALVEEGRAGHDVLVADSKSINNLKGDNMSKLSKVKDALKRMVTALDSVKENPTQEAVEQLETDIAKTALQVQRVEAELEGQDPEAFGINADTDACDDDFNVKEAVKYGENHERDKEESEEMAKDFHLQ